MFCAGATLTATTHAIVVAMQWAQLRSD